MKLFSHFFIYPLARHGRKVIYYALVRPQRPNAFFENRLLEIKENYNSYIEIGWSHPSLSENFLLSVYGRTTDALASGGYEGRGRLR